MGVPARLEGWDRFMELGSIGGSLPVPSGIAACGESLTLRLGHDRTARQPHALKREK